MFSTLAAVFGPVQPVPAPGAYPAHQHRHRPAGHRRRRCVRQGADRQPGHQAAPQHAGEGPPTAARRFRREAEQLLVPLRHRGAQRTRRLPDDHRAGVPVPQPDRADGHGSAQRRAASPARGRAHHDDRRGESGQRLHDRQPDHQRDRRDDGPDLPPAARRAEPVRPRPVGRLRRPHPARRGDARGRGGRARSIPALARPLASSRSSSSSCTSRSRTTSCTRR